MKFAKFLRTPLVDATVKCFQQITYVETNNVIWNSLQLIEAIINMFITFDAG